MTPIHIQFTRFSAFYSPLISAMSGGFLAAEGLEATHSVAPPGKSAIDALVAGTAQVAQSALSQGLTSLEKGEKPAAVHFAQIHEKDGFFLTAREPDPDFRWDKLRGRKVLVDHGGQPLAMFKFACHKMGLDFAVIDAVDAGNGAKLETDMAKAFMRAYRKTRRYVNETPAEEIAAAEARFFPDTDREVLAGTIAAYQKLGCWTPHWEITPAAYEVTLDVFAHVGRLSERPPYEAVCAAPPMED